MALIVWFARGQNRTELQKQRERNEKEIALTRQILEQTRNQKVSSLQLLSAYKRQISQRKILIRRMESELTVLDKEIENAREEISSISKELSSMKSEFGELIRQGYKSQKNHSRISFLFSSRSFNDALKRINYLRKLLEYRRIQLQLILKKQEQNSARINALLSKKNEKLSLIESRESEQEKLVSDQKKEELLINELKKKEGELVANLREKQAQAKQLDQLIKAAIETESDGSENNPEPVIPSNRVITGTFPGNKGRLPWPVQDGYVSEHFGVHKHTELKNITTQNNGINIATKPGAEVYPIFPGVVSAILEVPGMKRSILVKHDGFYTVYANLEEVFIERGQEVTTNDRLGRVVKNNEGFTEVHLEIWKGTDKLDPEEWLKEKL